MSMAFFVSCFAVMIQKKENIDPVRLNFCIFMLLCCYNKL